MASTEILKKKKKKWYEILASSEFNQATIGETLAADDNSLINRTVELNLANITNDSKMQNVNVKFKVKEVKNGKANTELIRYELLPTYIRRVVKPKKEKIDDSFLLETQDNIKIRLKPLFLTKTLTKNSILSTLRKVSKEFLENYCKKNDYSNLIKDLVEHNIQKEIKNILKRIYSLSVCEIRLMEKL